LANGEFGKTFLPSYGKVAFQEKHPRGGTKRDYEKKKELTGVVVKLKRARKKKQKRLCTQQKKVFN